MKPAYRHLNLPVRLLALLLAASCSTGSVAGEADVIGVKVRAAAGRTFGFDVTVRSRDTGWDYYAERFEVVAPDGAVLGTRVLVHPHETEQPFTRELDGVRIPPGIDRVTVRAWMKRGERLRAAGGATREVVLH
jgi:hypothetical protein